MLPFNVHDMIRVGEETRCKELKEMCETPAAFLQEQRRIFFAAIVEVLEQRREDLRKRAPHDIGERRGRCLIWCGHGQCRGKFS